MSSFLKKYLGKKVEVVIDRPLGSPHPEWGWAYPVNYGFLPGTRSPDGEEIDAYVLGPQRPLSRFKGRVIAVISRFEDKEGKLVVASFGRNFSEKEIKNLTYFQEKYFNSRIIKK